MNTSAKRKLNSTNDSTSSRAFHNSKKAHFSTPPKKQNHTGLVSTPFTPNSASDNLFQSIPKHFDEDYSLLSSPPPITPSAVKKNDNNVQSVINNTILKLSLSIGADGRASISKAQSCIASDNDSSQLETPTENLKVQGDNDIESSDNSKHEILSLLRKMRNGTSSVESSAKKLSHNIYPSSPPTVSILQTPRLVNSNMLIRTGLTPSFKEIDDHMVPLDEILLSTDKNIPAQEHDRQQQYITNRSTLVNTDTAVSLVEHIDQFPFKSSVGDPLLINDDEQWIQTINKSNDHPYGNEIRKLNNCSKKITVFDTPLLKEPSTPRRTHLNNLVVDVPSSTLIRDDTDNKDRIYDHDINNNSITVTPSHKKNSLQFTPLIQQTMTGSLGNKISPKMLFSPRKLSNPSTTTSISFNTSPNENEVEASTVLKRLITGFN